MKNRGEKMWRKHALERLTCMELLEDENTVNADEMDAFAGILAKLYLWNLKAYGWRPGEIHDMYELLKTQEENQEYDRMFLLLSISYDQTGNCLPNPIWWVYLVSDTASECFMKAFMVRLTELIDEGSINRPDKEEAM